MSKSNKKIQQRRATATDDESILYGHSVASEALTEKTAIASLSENLTLILAQLSEVLSKQAEQDNINSDLRAAIQSRSLTQEHSRQQPQDAGLSSDPHNHSQITATSETQFEDKAHKPEIVSALADAIRISTLKAPTLEHNDRLNIRLFKSKY
jgi:hypothetical protein